MQKGLCRNVCTSTVVISPEPLPPTASTSLGMKTPENTAEDPDDPVPADEGDIQWNTTLISCTAQVQEH
jgi:hypothetical protein